MKRSHILLGALLWVSSFALAQEQTSTRDFLDNIRTTSEVYTRLMQHFVDTISMEEAVGMGLNGMLQRLDPYTEYLTRTESELFHAHVRGQYGGIGAIISQRNDSTVIINEPMKGQAADKAGLLAGDRILFVDGKDMYGLPVTEVTKVLRGTPGSPIEMIVQRPGESAPQTKRFQRAVIEISPIPYYARHDGDVAVVRYTSFTATGHDELRKILTSMNAERPLKGLVLDLRGNGGGLLEGAVSIAGMFLPKASLIAEVKGRQPESSRRYLTSEDPLFPDLPVVVLIDEGSASASEIVAGALQDYDRATIMGQKSYGKGLVQQTFQLHNGGTLKLTTGRYYIPSGRCIQRLNYDHKGSASEIVQTDSLGPLYHTAGGRPVYGAGGIIPDIKLEEQFGSHLLGQMSIDTLTFDFVGTLAKSAHITDEKAYSINDETFEAYVKYLESNGFIHKSRSKQVVEQLGELMELEGLHSFAAAELEALEKSLQVEVRPLLTKHKEEIKEWLAGQVVLRANYREGYLRYLMPKDPQVQAALAHIREIGK